MIFVLYIEQKMCDKPTKKVATNLRVVVVRLVLPRRWHGAVGQRLHVGGVSGGDNEPAAAA